MPSPSVAPYDAVLLVSFGGPERPADVMPFLERVTRGRGVPADRLAAVAEHYLAVGGRSPINDQCRAFLAAVAADFTDSGIDLPLYWGNRNWDPLLADAVAQMARDGVRRAAAFVTSAYASYSGCRQYRENLLDAVEAVDGAPRIDRLRHYFNHPGFVAGCADGALRALGELPEADRANARIVFVTHSIPVGMAETSGPAGGAYVAQHRSVAALVAGRLASAIGRIPDWDLVYCSRSGSPRTPWLEPDVNDHLERLAREGVPSVVLAPIGFVSDHMEVVHDLDTEAVQTATRLGMSVRRAATAGTHPAFVATVRELLLERAAVERAAAERAAVEGAAAEGAAAEGAGVERRGLPERIALGELGPAWDGCEAGCCPNPRGHRPALCEVPLAVQAVG